MPTCAQPSDGVSTGLQTKVTRQGRDGWHEAHYEGVDPDHLVQLVNHNPSHQLHPQGDGQGRQPPQGQGPRAEWVQGCRLQGEG